MPSRDSGALLLGSPAPLIQPDPGELSVDVGSLSATEACTLFLSPHRCWAKSLGAGRTCLVHCPAPKGNKYIPTQAHSRIFLLTPFSTPTW